MLQIPRASHGAALGHDFALSFGCWMCAALAGEGPGHADPLVAPSRDVLGRSAPPSLNAEHSCSPEPKGFLFSSFKNNLWWFVLRKKIRKIGERYVLLFLFL